MNNEQLTEKILAIEPTAVVVKGAQYLTATVAPGKMHNLASRLCNLPETNFDFLFNLTGMDYGDSLGVLYFLESTTHKHELVLKTATTDKENPMLETVCDIWKTAEFLEREVFDFLGINFENHPDMRRIFLEDDWEGYPLRKDYTDSFTLVK